MSAAPPPERLMHSAGAAPTPLKIARAIRVLSAGNHHPLLCEMEDASGPAGVWVVKPCVVLSRSSDRGTFAILAELAGAEVCAWAGLLVPQVGLARFPDIIHADAIRIGASSVDPPERDEIVQIFSANKSRLAVCLRFLEGAPDLLRVHLARKRWRASSVRDATRLLLVDAVMRHDDRLEENPNALWAAGRLVVIDNGSAFAGLTRAGVRGEDLARRTQLHAPNFAQHVAYNTVRRYSTDADWDEAIAQLESVSDHAIAALSDTWPQELDDDEQSGQHQLRSRLGNFLAGRRTHVREVATQLRAMTKKKP